MTDPRAAKSASIWQPVTLGTELSDQPRHLACERLAVGDVLFCYTDGLIERRGRDIDEGLAGLLAAAGGCQRETADEAVIALFDRLEPPAAADDVCVLAVRVN